MSRWIRAQFLCPPYKIPASCEGFLLVIVSVAGSCWPQRLFLQRGGVEQHATDPPRVT